MLGENQIERQAYGDADSDRQHIEFTANLEHRNHGTETRADNDARLDG